MLIGERIRNRVVWIQIFQTNQSMNEDELRAILRDVRSHISKKAINSGSARKFKDGKLVYYETYNETAKPSRIYCLYTLETNISPHIKSAIQSVADRGGGNSVYSAKRFFSEVMDLVENPSQLKIVEFEIPNETQNINEVLMNISDINRLGQAISVLSKAEKLDWETLDKIYTYVYETLMSLLEGNSDLDTDEFLDAGYTVARSYSEHHNFTLGLELLKYLALVAVMNQRIDLEASCKLRIAEIYKKYFPPTGEFILEVLSNFSETHVAESSKPDREIYYSLMGYALAHEENHQEATKFYRMAIKEAGVNISSPTWIAEAYNYLGSRAMEQYNFLEAARLFMTASVISLIEGDISLSDSYMDSVAGAEIETSKLHFNTGLMFRLEGNLGDAEYRGWNGLRQLIRANVHISMHSRASLIEVNKFLISQAKILLQNALTNNKVAIFFDNLENVLHDGYESLSQKRLDNKFAALEKIVESYISIPPPTFMLLTLDGQLLLIGKIDGSEWEESDIKGVMLGGILIAIMSLINEVSGKTSLRTVDAGNFKIMIEKSDNEVVALLVDRDLSEFRRSLQNILKDIEQNYSNEVKKWNGNVKTFEKLKGKVVEHISSAFKT